MYREQRKRIEQLATVRKHALIEAYEKANPADKTLPRSLTEVMVVALPIPSFGTELAKKLKSGSIQLSGWCYHSADVTKLACQHSPALKKRFAADLARSKKRNAYVTKLHKQIETMMDQILFGKVSLETIMKKLAALK